MSEQQTMKSIIMSGWSVRAILGDRKGQTRRVIKPQPPDDWDTMVPIEGSKNQWCFYKASEPYIHNIIKVPYQPGDILYVRETFAYVKDIFEKPRAWKWRSPYHMPKDAARLFLKVTDVRVERVQEITEKDALAEGAVKAYPTTEGYSLENEFGTYRGGFAALWDTLNAAPKPVIRKRKVVSYVSYPWEEIREEREHRGKPWIVHGNPWSWVYGLKRTEARE